MEHDEGVCWSGEPPLLGALLQIQPQLTIDAPHPYMVPAMFGALQPVHVFPNTQRGLGVPRVVRASSNGAFAGPSPRWAGSKWPDSVRRLDKAR